MPAFRTATLLGALALAACQAAPQGTPDAGPGPLHPDPALYDCRNPAPLPRQSATPYACLVDRACTERLVAAHRGGGGELGVLAPENTLSAVRAAIAVGADFVETDPRPSKDGVIVNVHDTTVDRVTLGTGNVADLTAAELQALAIDPLRFPGDFSCERIATLREVLETSVGRVMVLVDANKTDRVDLLVQDIVAAGALEWAVFDTSSPAKIEEALRLEPRLLTMIRVDDVAGLDAQLAQFAAHPPIIVEVNRFDGTKDLADAVRARGHRPFTDIFVEDLVVAFDGPLRTYDKSWALGVDIVQTDRPAEVLRYLGRR